MWWKVGIDQWWKKWSNKVVTYAVESTLHAHANAWICASYNGPFGRWRRSVQIFREANLDVYVSIAYLGPETATLFRKGRTGPCSGNAILTAARGVPPSLAAKMKLARRGAAHGRRRGSRSLRRLRASITRTRLQLGIRRPSRCPRIRSSPDSSRYPDARCASSRPAARPDFRRGPAQLFMN
jgi:hypothetical protein